MAILEDEGRRCLGRIRISDGSVGRLCVRRGNVLYRRDVGVGAGTAAIENRRTALIVVLGIIRAVFYPFCGTDVGGIRNCVAVGVGSVIRSVVVTVPTLVMSGILVKNRATLIESVTAA